MNETKTEIMEGKTLLQRNETLKKIQPVVLEKKEFDYRDRSIPIASFGIVVLL